MPDYLGEDQRKTKVKDEKDDDKPIKGFSSSSNSNSNSKYFSSSVLFSALDEAEIAVLKSYVSFDEFENNEYRHFV